jgi:formylglycine-generating enzyme required for sulfatase activity
MCAMENGSMTSDPDDTRIWRDGPQAPWMVTLSADSFTMGAGPGDKFANNTERPAHRAAIGRFALGRFPVTVAEYVAFRADHAPDDNPELPVTYVSWEDAQEYCHWLHNAVGRHYRLPSESEWEFACRAGSTAPFTFGADITPREANFFYSETGEHVGPGRRTKCGVHPANEFGLHDLHGNICEWVEDTWHTSYKDAPADGSAWIEGGDPQFRVIRGGAWDYLPRLLRSSWRDCLAVNRRRDNVGFRIATSEVPG